MKLTSFNSGIENNTLILETNTSSSHLFSATVNNGNSIIDSSRVTYAIDAGSLNCQITNNNTLSIQAGTTSGVYNVKISVLVDGVQVGDVQTIQIKVRQNNTDIINSATTWNGANSEHLEIYNIGIDGQQVTSIGFADLYNRGDATIQLHVAMDCGGDKYNDQINVAKERISQLGNLVVEALSTAGLDKNILTQAANNVVQRYQGTIDSVRHKDSSGKHASNMIGNISRHMNENRESYGHRICVGWDTDGDDSFVFAVRFRDFVDDILAEYWSLAGY